MIDYSNVPQKSNASHAQEEKELMNQFGALRLSYLRETNEIRAKYLPQFEDILSQIRDIRERDSIK